MHNQFKLTDRRSEGFAGCYANADKTEDLLDQQVELTIQDMCKNTWHWQSQNPNGYK